MVLFGRFIQQIYIAFPGSSRGECNDLLGLMVICLVVGIMEWAKGPKSDQALCHLTLERMIHLAYNLLINGITKVSKILMRNASFSCMLNLMEAM